MRNANESYLALVKEAYRGELQLPAFQREWKWESSKVLSLYDSLRKGFPIGSFLFLKKGPIDLGPRPFAALAPKHEQVAMTRLTLDGQQRITAGIALFHGLERGPRFFLNLKKIKDDAEKNGHFDYDNDEAVATFLQELDDGDGYLQSTSKRTDADTLLLENHLLSSAHLLTESKLKRVLERYVEHYPESKKFCDYLVSPHFVISDGYTCPTVTLDEEESLSAVTRIFETINTTGKTLTPVEIVTAVLYSGSIDLKKEVEEFHEASDYLSNMDANGEVLLQTIALLAGKTPKKSLLPKNITREIFNRHFQDALSLLDSVGEQLSLRLGAGLKHTAKLLPYQSILAPMAAVHAQLKNLSPGNREKALKKLDAWFVGAALSQRYQEGVHNKQEGDRKDFEAWLEDETAKPSWLDDTTVDANLKVASPNGAIGKLVKCMINSERPRDPITDVETGFYEGATSDPEYHHIYPKKFCTDHLDGWRDDDTADLALNMIPLSSATNLKWHKMNPRDQLADAKNARRDSELLVRCYEKLLLGGECLSRMDSDSNTKANFVAFIDARFDQIAKRLKIYGFSRTEVVVDGGARDL